MSVGYNQDHEWFIDENGLVLTPTRRRRMPASGGTCPAVFAMHAFSPSSQQEIVEGFRRRFLKTPTKDVIARVGFCLCKPRKTAKTLYSNGHKIKQTVEQTMAHIVNFPGKYSFPVMTVDGSELFSINSEISNRIVEKFNKTNNVRGGRVSKEIIAISELASGIRPDVDLLDLVKTTSNKLNVKERTFVAALENYDSVVKESNTASAKMNRGSPFTEEMLPGQVPSNLLKQIASTDSIMSVRGLHGRPITCSVSATPVLISNSYILKYYVDTAMYKRMLIFPFDTNFAAKNVEPNVEFGDNIVRTGLKIIHASLLCKRANMWGDKKKYSRVLKERLDEWNDLTGCVFGLEQVDSLVSQFPSVFLKHVIKNKVLELSDNSNHIKLTEACNTFFQAHTSMMLASRPNTLLKEKREDTEEDDDDDETTPSHKQICTINSKTMDTLHMCIDRANSGGVWGMVNLALRSVIFITAPFVDTKALYGEGCTVKMMLDNKTSTTINMSSGLRLPDSDGIGKNGTIGIGDALMRQLVGSWGSTNIKNSMYSCHHLHIMFELVMQQTTIQKKLKNVGDMSSDYMSNVAFLLVSSIYIEMFERYGIFDENRAKRMRLTQMNIPTYPVFMCIIVNKSIGHLNSLTNLADNKEKNDNDKHHTRRVSQVLNDLGKYLNTMYLCPTCKAEV